MATTRRRFRTTLGSKPIKKTGTYKGKSNTLGYGGRARQLNDELTAKGLPKKEVGAIIGERARAAGAAPGGPNYHGGK